MSFQTVIIISQTIVTFFQRENNSCTYYLPHSNSESDENDLDIEDDLDWKETDEMPN